MNGKSILKYTATAALGLLCAGSVMAGNVGVSATDSNYLALATGSALVPAGDLIEVGSFTISDASVAALATANNLSQANYATLLADFTIYGGGVGAVGSSTMGTGASGDAGAFSATFQGNNMVASAQTYMLVFNAATTGAASQVGVFRGASFAGAGDWQFPANPATGANSFDLDDAAVLLGTYTANTPLDVPYNDANVGDSPINTLNLDTITVPEPSSIALVVLGLAGSIGMIRRRRS